MDAFLLSHGVLLVKYLCWAFVTAAGFLHLFLGIMLHSFLPSQMMYFQWRSQGLPGWASRPPGKAKMRKKMKKT